MGKRTDELVMITDDEPQDSKSKQNKPKNKSKDGNMKKFLKNNGKVIVTVLVTLVVVAAFAYTFYSGVTYERRRQADVKAKIESAVANTETLKQ